MSSAPASFPSASAVTEPAIDIDGVSRSFGPMEVLKEVSLKVERGVKVGLLGPSGSGKTTLVRMVAGVDRPDRGRVRVEGHEMPSLSMLARIGYMAQSDALYQDLSGQENLEFFGALYELHSSRLHDRISHCAGLVGLDEHLHRPVRHYSGGMRRRLSLAITLLHEPGVLILDEPTVGIDPVLRKSIWQALRAYADSGAAILVTTHVMGEAERCDIVCMLREGRLIAVDTPAALKAAAGVDSLEEAFLHFGSGR